jgi:hypothetical protein
MIGRLGIFARTDFRSEKPIHFGHFNVKDCQVCAVPLQMRLRGEARGKGADVIPLLGQHLLQWCEYFNFVIYNNDLCHALSSPVIAWTVA